MAVNNAQILDFLETPNLTDAQIATAMQRAGVSAAQLAQATGANVAEVTTRLLTEQILAQATTDKWTGQGKGSPQANAADMAKMLVSAGITDVNQFGKVPLYEPVQEIGKTYNGQTVRTQYNEDGTSINYIYKGSGQYYQDGDEISTVVELPKNAPLETVYGIVRDGGESGGYLEPVDISKLKTVDGKLSADTGGTTFGNKLTGQAVANNYETGSNAFGGTYDGKGNTGYRVEFDASGKPLFYTTGASSSDVPKWVKPALILGAAYFGLDAAGLLGGGLGATEAAALTAGDLAIGGGALAGTPFTAAQLAGFTAETAGTGLLSSGSLTAGLTAADIAALEAGLPSAGASLTTGLTAAQIAAAEAGLPSGLGSLTAGITAADIAAYEAALPSGLGSLTAGITAADIAAAEAGLPSGLGSITAGITAADIAAGEAALPSAASLTAGMTAAQIAASEKGLPAATTVAGTTAKSKVLTDALTRAGVTAAVNNILGGGGTTGTNLSNLFSSGLGTAGNLLQMQQSREAAQQAQARIDAETAAAKQSAAFRPVGMTTRFGTSQFQTNPVTGQLTSAGYTLSPEAKAQQDRFVALSNQGLTQAEGAQAQFAPLQTGAQSLFNLGNQYISQSPQSVAQNYLNQQMALLQPGRELEFANLQTKLRNQGRQGLSVAQGGDLGATTPELQALFNARARQEAELAANAQQLGQRDVLFGSSLLGQGSQAMGQYYGGQQAAYTPYTTAQGQVQNLETLGQQPYNMGVNLGQIGAQTGFNVGQLGLRGAQLSAGLATSDDATRNLLAQGLTASGNPNAMFGQAIGKTLGGLFNTAPATSGFSYGQYGTGIDPSTGEFFGSLYF